MSAAGLFSISVLVVGLAVATPAGARPVSPCSAQGGDPDPPYAALGGAPNVRVWRDADLAAGPCTGVLAGRSRLVVALAGRFAGAATMDEMAARVGAVSATGGLKYWSITDGRWRELIADAYALDSPETKDRRGDFTAAEVLSGRTLYFVQDDTRSTSLNVYAMTGRRIGRGRLVVEVVNLSPIRFVLFNLFDARVLRVSHVFEREAPSVWRYYGLSTVRDNSADGNEGSLVNRAAAAYRFYRGVPGDRGPPLAR